MRKDNDLLRTALHKPSKLIRGLISFILGAGLIAYSFETELPETIYWAYPGIILMFVGVMLLLMGNCAAHENNVGSETNVENDECNG